MAAGPVKLYNTGLEQLAQNADVQWDVTTAGNWYWMLGTNSYVPARTHSTVNDLAGNYISTGDGVPLERGPANVAIDNSSGNIQFKAGEANWGSSVTILGAKWLILVQGNAASISPSDKLVFWVDLNTSGTVSSSNALFRVVAPTDNIWFQIDAQVQS